MFDQTRIYGDNWQDSIKPLQESYERYFSTVESELPENAKVYVLPYMAYPEAGFIHNIHDYKHFAGYVFTDKIHWSYGGLKGRNNLARDLNICEGMSQTFLYEIKEAGFNAVYIDLDGYADGGAEILTFYNSLGITPMVSENGMLYTYNISALEVSEARAKPGYGLLNSWTIENRIDLSEDELVNIASGLINADYESLYTIATWFDENEKVKDSNNEEYIQFLYLKLLGREAENEGRALWSNQLAQGVDRKEIFVASLTSDEFRTKNQLK